MSNVKLTIILNYPFQVRTAASSAIPIRLATFSRYVAGMQAKTTAYA